MLTLTGRTIAETRQSKTLADLNQNLAREVRERKKAQRELERLATHDPLTGLKNRRVFDQALDDWIALFQRQKSPFVACIIDLDHFKQINDVYGHLAGDAVLAEIGRCLSKSVRDTDVITRYGGEEFALLLRDTNAGTAQPSWSGCGALSRAYRCRWRITPWRSPRVLGLLNTRTGRPMQ